MNYKITLKFFRLIYVSIVCDFLQSFKLLGTREKCTLKLFFQTLETGYYRYCTTFNFIDDGVKITMKNVAYKKNPLPTKNDSVLLFYSLEFKQYLLLVSRKRFSFGVLKIIFITIVITNDCYSYYTGLFLYPFSPS